MRDGGDSGGMAEASKILGANCAIDRVLDSCHYDQLLKVGDLLQMLIASSDFIRIVKELQSHQCLRDDVSSRIIQLAEQRLDQNSTADAWKLFLEYLPTSSDCWYWQFMNLLSDTAENRSVRDFISPMYEEELKIYKTSLEPVAESNAVQSSGYEAAEGADFGQQSNSSRDEEMVTLDVRQPFEDWLNGADVPSTSQPFTVYDDDYSDSDDDEVPAERLELRPYQRELLIHAIAGRNTVIVAPTGSGKTYVATEIVLRHLETKNGPSEPKRKVAFLVPAVDLVQQQASVLKRFLRRPFKVKALRGGQVGSRQLPKALHISRNDVLVMTPQLLLNMMMNPSPNVDPVPLGVFTLLIFDECHHAEKGHPYNEIMTQYLDTKLSSASSGTLPVLPQVVGLTASLGVGGADTPLQARLHVLSVCANMDGYALSTVVEHLDNLIEHVSVPIDELVRVPSNYAVHPFATHVRNLILKIENEFVKPMLDELDKSDVALARPKYTSSFDPPAKKHSSDYRSWVFGWLHELPTSREVAIKERLITAFEHLTVYHNALFLNGHVPTAQAFAYLSSQCLDFERRQVSRVDRELITLYKHELMPHVQMGGAIRNNQNAMVEKLREILLEEFRERPDGRALVFVCTRELTAALMEFMNGDAPLQFLQAARLTGVRASKQKGGQSAGEQSEILDRFRSGYHRVLIVTSVVEEGLDVAKCNLVIKYNHVSDEIALVQRRGRGRAAGSRSVLIAQDGRTEDKEMINMIREKMMMSAIEYISRMGSDWFRDEVRKAQMQAYNDRFQNKAITERQRNLLGGKVYQLLCRKCDQFLVSSADVRRAAGSHYVAIDPSIWERVRVDAEQSPRIYENLVQAGRVYCSKCSTECGNIVKYVTVYLPTLKADAFVQQADEILKERNHHRKWKRMTEELFVVDALTHQDLRRMFNSLKSESVLAKLEQRIHLAEQQREEEARQEKMESSQF